MENAIEALYMGAAVMIFVIALTVSVASFGRVRQTSQMVLDYKDREYETSYLGDDGADISSTTRTVGLETIVPSIYKAFKENYKIVFKGCETMFDNKGIYQIKYDGDINASPIYTIDLAQKGLSLGNDADKEKFIGAVLYGDKYGGFTDIQTNFANYKITLHNRGIYDKIKGEKFKEDLGIYYASDLEQNDDVPDVNEQPKRVITYTLQ